MNLYRSTLEGIHMAQQQRRHRRIQAAAEAAFRRAVAPLRFRTPRKPDCLQHGQPAVQSSSLSLTPTNSAAA